MSLVDDIATYLETSSTVFTRYSGTAGNLARQAMLDNLNLDPMTVLYETAGGANAYTMSTGTGSADVTYETPSLQILSRSTSYQTARSRADTAYTILDGLAQVNLPTATGTLYLDVSAVQAPFFTGYDENHRPIVSVNFTIRKRVG